MLRILFMILLLAHASDHLEHYMTVQMYVNKCRFLAWVVQRLHNAIYR